VAPKAAPSHGVCQLVARFQAISPDHGHGPPGCHSLGDQKSDGLVERSAAHVDIKIDLPAHGTPETPLGHQHPVGRAGLKKPVSNISSSAKLAQPS
jgi:hypothetical protein